MTWQHWLLLFTIAVVLATGRLILVALLLHQVREYVESRSWFSDYVEVALWYSRIPVAPLYFKFWRRPVNLLGGAHGVDYRLWRKHHGLRKS